MNRNSNAVIAGLLLCLSVAVAAFAIDFAESVDFPGGVSFASNPSIGTLTLGSNTVSGSLAGNCVVGDCNGGAAGDTQDSLLFTVPSGFQVTSLTVTTSSVTGPTGFTLSLDLRDPTAILVFGSVTPLSGTTANQLSSPLVAGQYALTLFGGTAAAAGPFSLNWLATMNLAVAGSFPTVTPTAPATSSLCSPTAPASISGSTGAQGVLDPTNTIPPDQPDGGLIWPAGTLLANIFLDTGAVVFTDAANAVLGTTTLPGVGGSFPAFFDGRLHFSRVNLPAGTGVTIAVNATTQAGFTPFAGKTPPAVVLSCGDVILETGSALAVGAPIDGHPVFGATPVVFPGAFAGGGAAMNLPAAGFGPRSGSGAAAGAIYPSMGGAGGASGSVVVNCGLGVDCPSGGFGGGALVLAAAQRVRINGTIYAVGTNALPGNPGAQGGGGGSVRIAGTLVEGNGVINTSGGTGSVNGANGPIEIQAFVQDVFAGTATGSPVRGNPVAAPLPSNLPDIDIVYVAVAGSDACGFDCSNTGSLVSPDVELGPASAAQTVEVEAQTTGVPLGTSLVFRAVGTDGSVSQATGSVVASTPCTGGQGACVNLLLNPGATYQIVVTPSAAFPLAREPQAAPMRGPVQVTGLREGSEGADLAARWARALGADPRTLEAQVARMTVKLGSTD